MLKIEHRNSSSSSSSIDLCDLLFFVTPLQLGRHLALLCIMPSSSTHKSCEERDSCLTCVVYTVSTWIELLCECEKDAAGIWPPFSWEVDADPNFSWPHVSQRCRRTSLAFCGPSPPTQTWKLSNRLPNNFVIHHQQGCFWASGTTLCRIPDRWVYCRQWVLDFLTIATNLISLVESEGANFQLECPRWRSGLIRLTTAIMIQQKQLCSTFLVFIFIFSAKANSALGPPGNKTIDFRFPTLISFFGFRYGGSHRYLEPQGSANQPSWGQRWFLSESGGIQGVAKHVRCRLHHQRSECGKHSYRSTLSRSAGFSIRFLHPDNF